jgi:hypothetical protein
LRKSGNIPKPTIIILSSVKPLCGDRYSELQGYAIDSWKKISDGVVLFNKPEDFSNSSGVRYLPSSSNPPKLKEILAFAKTQDAPLVIVNSDIQLSKESYCAVHDLYKKHGMIWGATSFRHEDRGHGLVVQDLGLDFFAATGEVWKRAYDDIPDFLTLGRGLWDNWMNGWFRKNLPPHRYYDLTPLRCVIHPTHDREPGRLSAYTEEQARQVLTHPKIKCGGIPLKKYTKKCGSK